MGRLGMQLLSEDNTWSKRDYISKIDRYIAIHQINVH